MNSPRFVTLDLFHELFSTFLISSEKGEATTPSIFIFLEFSRLARILATTACGCLASEVIIGEGAGKSPIWT